MFARIVLAVPFGAAVTAALLFVMHLFIAADQSHTAKPPVRPVEFVRVERGEAVQPEREKPERPTPPEPVPDLPRPGLDTDFSSALAVAMHAPAVDAAMSLKPMSLGGGSGEYLPLVKVQPAYPMRALQRRLEGYVVVEFIVTASGSVRDVTVVESSSEVFEQAAIEAALKFKYKPRTVDGVPVEVGGVQNRITFTLKV